MAWVVFSYSFPAKTGSSPRVMVWRRLGRLGAIATTSGVYVLPARDECVEAFQWLAQETRQAKGAALVMRVDQFEGLADQQLVDLFNQARRAEYEELDRQASELEKNLSAKKKSDQLSRIQDGLAKLRRRFDEAARVDYFYCPEAARVAAHLEKIGEALAPSPTATAQVAPETMAAFQGKRWVTRPRPHVDRLACAWLIRRFIDPHAVIRYASRPEPDEISFDMHGGRLEHRGNRCTFEVMLEAFTLDDRALGMMAEIVHEIDLRDGQYTHPAIAGIDGVLSGWLMTNLSDAELEAHGVALFEGLYATLANRPSAKAQARKPKRTR